MSPVGFVQKYTQSLRPQSSNALFVVVEEKKRLAAIVACLLLLIATADWYVGRTLSLGGLYLFPIALSALACSPAEILCLAIICSILRATFDVPCLWIEACLRFVFAFLAYSAAGFLVIALRRTRGEEVLRRQAQHQLKTLTEGGPAAIVIVDASGSVTTANRAADELFAFSEGESIVGRSIDSYLPLLGDALLMNAIEGDLRTATQCQGRRANGELFPANVWFSSHRSLDGTNLAAIITDGSEEMREREEDGLRRLLLGNRIATSVLSHEVRNLSSAMLMVLGNLKAKYSMAGDEDFRALNSMTKGLEKMTATAVHSGEDEPLEELPLQSVLDDLRVIIESEWREIEGFVRWELSPNLPHVHADRQGLLQACLNLSQNSRRAVRFSSRREFEILVSTENPKVAIRFVDSGPGIAAPERLFKPFQPGVEGTGLGLCISRAMIRNWGGDLRFESRSSGCCFVIDLCAVPAESEPLDAKYRDPR
jgi:PAS domain S-box-containing protein